jgi:GTP-binding protein LepA
LIALVRLYAHHIVCSPDGDPAKPLRVLLFDNWYDKFRGVVCLVKVVDGVLKKGDKITAAHSQQKYEVMDVGILYPDPVVTGAL